jgi:hypothetical protein
MSKAISRNKIDVTLKIACHDVDACVGTIRRVWRQHAYRMPMSTNLQTGRTVMSSRPRGVPLTYIEAKCDNYARETVMWLKRSICR